MTLGLFVGLVVGCLIGWLLCSLIRINPPDHKP